MLVIFAMKRKWNGILLYSK